MPSFSGRSIGDLTTGYSVDVDLNSGAAALRVPVPASPGRSRIAPDLTLEYSSGAGNSAFGAGWGLTGLPIIGLDTRLNVPRWDGGDGYQFNGDPLVPWLEQQPGGWTPGGFTNGDWSVAFLRSRRRGTLVRVEKWLHRPTGRMHFRTRDAGDTLTIYGARPNAAARIADPDDETRTFAWLPELVVDPHGNALWIDYAAETLDGIDRTAPFERRAPSPAQRYLKRLRYGNSDPLALDDAVTSGTPPAAMRWFFQLVLDYGDHAADPPAATPDQPWPARLDPFSSNRNGFEIRTWRLCRRFLAFHDFPELGPRPALVGALTFNHEQDPAGSTLREIVRTGWRQDGGAATSRSIPPLRMTYAPAASNNAFLDAPEEARENLPAGLTGRQYSFVSLFGDGMAGILCESDRVWYFKPNLGEGRFGAQTMVAEHPAVRAGTFRFGDVDSDGDTDLSQLSGRLAGLYEFRRDDAAWSGFRPFATLPHVEALGPQARWVDLNGDGRADLVVSREDHFTWFASDGDSFLPPVDIPRPVGLDAVPTLANELAAELFFADMTGDGLADLVRIRNGSITYWPSLGNGRFGDIVVMDGVPRFAPDADYDPTRLRLIDLDGSGTTDIVYIGQGEVATWINAAGNRLLAGPRISGLPSCDNLSSVSVLDFLGDGGICLVWSTPLPGKPSTLSYLRLTPSLRPRLLVSVDDSMGRETRLAYASSAAHYLRDLASGRGWSSRLPAHRTVVDRREVFDRIGGTGSARSFAYHDGHYDGVEREFRGFGQVDAYDMALSEAQSSTKPALVRTWFHLGTSMWSSRSPPDIYTADAALPRLAPHVIDPAGLRDPDDIEDGLRALAGQTLRREVYATDAAGVPRPHPFEVYQASYALRLVQPAAGDAAAAFAASRLEDATWTYEQQPDDPRLNHQIVLETDAYDRPLRDVVIGYARRAGRPRDVAAQDRNLLEVHERRVTDTQTPDRLELGVPIEGKRFELAGLRPGPTGLFTRDQLRAQAVSDALAAPGPFHVDLSDDPALGPRTRLLAWERSFYWNDARDAPLPLGQTAAKTLVHHEEAACFAPDFVTGVLGNRVDDPKLAALGYRLSDGLWWQVEATSRFTAADRFSQRNAFERGDGAITRFDYDAHSLLVQTETDPAGNALTAEIDYQQLAPWRLIDANGNISEARYDPLGVIVTATNYGHVLDQPWGFDPLAAVVARAPPNAAAAIADPATYVQGAARYVWYDLDAWSRDATPTLVLALNQEVLPRDGGGGGGAAAPGRVQVELSFLDGLGRALQEKTRVEPGPAVQRDAAGHIVVDAGGRPVLAAADPRWRASGHVVYDAKQQPIQQFEPFFSGSPAYESDDVLRQFGTATFTAYDAVGRDLGQSFANGTTSSVAYRSWSVERGDPNDNVTGSAWALTRQNLPAADPERLALEEAKPHAGTTQLGWLDPLGRDCGHLIQGGATAADARTEARLDLDGNCREMIDARGLTAFRFRQDMAGRVIYQNSIDAGESWSLADAYGRAALAWDARGFAIARGFDAADRPLFTDVTGGDGPVPLNHRVEQRVYGETLADRADAVRRNLLGRVAITRDGSAETAVDRYDPASHLIAATRHLRADLDTEADWRAAVPLEPQGFTTAASFDGLGRPLADTLPDGSIRHFEYLASGALTRVRITTPDGALVDAPILDGVTSGARGETVGLVLGNAVRLDYGYDPDTFRLTALTASRGAQTLQRIRYTYDPAGNITRITDDAQEGPNALIGGVAVPAVRDYGYDALYRLRQASGRVHRALLPRDYVPGSAGTFRGSRLLSLNDGGAVERFTQTYDYDAAGNLLRLRHAGTSQNWTTDYWVSPASNRSQPALDLNGIAIAAPEASFDAAGNLVQQAHLRAMAWNWAGSLARAVVIRRPGGTDDAERYVHGADGMRVRKVATRVLAGGVVEATEKVYLGDAERKRITRDGVLILERWTLHVGDGGQRLALVHRWTKDDSARETDALGQPRIHYQINTHQGSSAIELDAQGKLISYEEYLPYGGTAFVAGDDAREISLKDYRYAGKECDDFTGFHAYGYRYYAPWLARWISPDPIGPEDDLNLYLFVLGDPIGRVDPNGLETQPGEVVYANRAPPARIDSVDGQVAAYRAALRPIYQTGFDQLSHDEQVRLTYTPGAWLVPKDPRAETGTTGWAVITDDQYQHSWLPARQEWSKERGHHVVVDLLSDNPGRLGGGGMGGGADKKDHEEAATPPGAAPADAKAPAGGEAKGPGGGGGTAKDKGDGNGGGGKDPGDAVKGDGAGQGDGHGKGKGEGQGTGATGKGGKPGNGKTGAGGGPGVRGVGHDTSGVYSNDFGGMRGGRPDGVLGGTPNSPGHTPGGQGNRPEGPAGGGPGSGRPGGGPSQGVSGEGTHGPSEPGKGGPPGPGGHRDPTHGPPGAGPGTGAPGGAHKPMGEGPAGAGQDAQGAGGPTGWKGVLLDIAGMTNFVFDNKEPGGDPGGIPGGLGWLGLKGSWLQWLYIGVSFINFAALITGIGELVEGLIGAAKGLFTLGRAAIRELPALARLGWRGLGRAFEAVGGLLRGGGSRLGWGLRNLIFNRGQALRTFVGDTGLWASRLQPGARAIANEIIRDAANHIIIPRSVLTELGSAARITTKIQQYYRLITTRAAITVEEDVVTAIVTKGKFGPVDFQVVRAAADRGLAVVTANVKMAAQISGDKLLRALFGGVQINAVGKEVKAASDLATLIP